jgi:hypothetical protein
MNVFTAHVPARWHELYIYPYMKEKNYTGLIPVNTSGKEINAEACIETNSIDEAISLYKTVRQRLLNVNNWHTIAGLMSAVFQLVEETGKEADRNVQTGDYLRVDIPGPGSAGGEGYDWVRVEEMNEIKKPEVESIGFRVRPTANPLNKEANVAHFYSNASTSTFIVTRENKIIIAGVYDRNTKPNEKAESVTDKIRHTVIGISAVSAFSKIQWQNLANGLLA